LGWRTNFSRFSHAAGSRLTRSSDLSGIAMREGSSAPGVLQVADSQHAPHALPDLHFRQPLRVRDRGEHRLAGSCALARGQEERARLRGHFGVAARHALLEGVAGDLDVVAEHLGIFGAEELPGARGAQRFQPFAAQAFRQGRVGVAIEESAHVARVAALHAPGKQPVSGVGFEHMPGKAGPIGVEGLPLAALGRFPGPQHVGIPGRLGARRRRRERHRRRAHRGDRQIDASQGHSNHG
jgi:hypothetical protein